MKVGDYVRILYLSGISKVAKLEKINDICITDKGAVDKNNIIKSSPNIIDLIEVGDYVNGFKVSFKGKDIDPFVQCDYPVEYGTTNHYRFSEKAIYSIVTKEQFKAMEYRIGE